MATFGGFVSARSFSLVLLVFFVGWYEVNADSRYACNNPDRADWMASGVVGLSSHYFAHSIPQLNKLADQLRICEVADQVESAGAAWLLFSIHHQPWLMMAPNDTYDRLLGNTLFTSSRDVPLELFNALHRKGIRLMLYVNLRMGSGSVTPESVVRSMGGWPPNDILVHNIASVYREFSVRYGNRVAGWWVDGVQSGSAWGKSPSRERWFEEIAAALRAGNKDAVVAFNPGLAITRYSLQDDYIAGESVDLRDLPNGRCLDGAQLHLWTYVGENWGSGGRRFSNERLRNYAKLVNKKGGAMTLEVGMTGLVKSSSGGQGIVVPENEGRIDPIQVEQIRLVTQGIRQITR